MIRKGLNTASVHLPIFLAQCQPQALSRKKVCLFNNLGAFFSPETMYLFSNCRSISQGLQQRLFLLSLWNLSLAHFICHACLFLIHPSCATQVFRVFSFTLSTQSSTKEFWHAFLFSMWGPFLDTGCLCYPSLALLFYCAHLTKGSQTCSHYSRCRLLFIAQPFSLVSLASTVLPNWPFSVIFQFNIITTCNPKKGMNNMNMCNTLACNPAISWNLSLVSVGRAYSLCFCLSSCN